MNLQSPMRVLSICDGEKKGEEGLKFSLEVVRHKRTSNSLRQCSLERLFLFVCFLNFESGENEGGEGVRLPQ